MLINRKLFIITFTVINLQDSRDFLNQIYSLIQLNFWSFDLLLIILLILYRISVILSNDCSKKYDYSDYLCYYNWISLGFGVAYGINCLISSISIFVSYKISIHYAKSKTYPIAIFIALGMFIFLIIC